MREEDEPQGLEVHELDDEWPEDQWPTRPWVAGYQSVICGVVDFDASTVEELREACDDYVSSAVEHGLIDGRGIVVQPWGSKGWEWASRIDANQELQAYLIDFDFTKSFGLKIAPDVRYMPPGSALYSELFCAKGATGIRLALSLTRLGRVMSRSEAEFRFIRSALLRQIQARPASLLRASLSCTVGADGFRGLDFNLQECRIGESQGIGLLPGYLTVFPDQPSVSADRVAQQAPHGVMVDPEFTAAAGRPAVLVKDPYPTDVSVTDLLRA